MNKKTLKVFSPAKINLFLYIGKKRKDGFHSLSSFVVPLKHLGDDLTFKKTDKNIINVHTKLSKKINIPAFKKLLPEPKKNIIHQAASLFFKEAKIAPGIDIYLTKNTPLSAGMGGGSSNAASTLLSLNKLYNAPLSQKKLFKLSAKLGSDVPLFMQKGPALISGRGDRVKHDRRTDLAWEKTGQAGWFVILNPKHPISTPWAYQQWDKDQASLTKKRQNVKNDSLFLRIESWQNDFEKVIFPDYPSLKKAKEKLMTAGAKKALLSGSGPTVWALFGTKKAATKALKSFSLKWICWVTKGVS